MIRRLLLLTLFVVSVALPQASRAEQARPVSPSTPQPLAINAAPLASEPNDLEQPITITKTTTSFTHTVFTQVQTLSTARRNHTSTLLPNGQVLTVGGKGAYDTDVSRLAERYDPATNQIISVPSLTYGRVDATATLLPTGEVLVAGGSSLTAELYNPATNRWRLARDMQVLRSEHTATLLPNGKVLLVGGWQLGSYPYPLFASAELYDPATNRFSPAASMSVARAEHTAVSLPNGDVLVVGGNNNVNNVAERYVVATGQWQSVPLATGGYFAASLSNGEVVIASRFAQSLQRYNPTTGSVTLLNQSTDYQATNLLPVGQDYFLIMYVVDPWSSSFFSEAKLYHAPSNTLSPIFSPLILPTSTTVTLADGRIVALGGMSSNGYYQPGVDNFISIGTLRPPTRITASVTIPGVHVDDRIWFLRQHVPVQFQVWAEPAVLNKMILKLGNHWSYYPMGSNGQVISTTVQIEYMDYAQLTLALVEAQGTTMYGETGLTTSLFIADVGYDPVLPDITSVVVPASTPSPVWISWYSSQPYSPLWRADLEVRATGTLTWTRLLSKAQLTTTNLHLPIGSHEIRVRRYDHLGRVSDWFATQPIQITSQRIPPSAIWINHGALAATQPESQVFFAPHLVLPDPVAMRLSDDGITWQEWQGLATRVYRLLTAPDGVKNVWVQFRSTTGTLTTPVFASIKLDTRLGRQAVASINNGALFTNDPLVRVLAGNPIGGHEMQISNDGGFLDAVWQPFDSEPLWRITTYGTFTIPRTVYVRVRNEAGNISNAYSDDIIYDPFAPTGSLTVTAQTTTTLSIALAASDPDGISGLGGMRVGTPEQFAVASWEPFAANKTLAVTNTTTLQPIYAQFRDNANNMTPILCVTPAGAPCGLTPRTYLSFIKQ